MRLQIRELFERYQGTVYRRCLSLLRNHEEAEEARDDRNPYGFIGRDGPLLLLERAMHRPPAGGRSVMP